MVVVLITKPLVARIILAIQVQDVCITPHLVEKIIWAIEEGR